MEEVGGGRPLKNELPSENTLLDTSVQKEWEAKARVVESNVGSATARVDPGLASLALQTSMAWS